MKTLAGLTPDGVTSAVAERRSFAPNKWQLLTPVEEARATLGLKGTSIAVLRAMLSFVRADQISAHRDADHVCFASNASLAQRAHVSVQTVERHISKLVTLGLLTRRSSGNGKRWARRDRGGTIVLATGLSLLPLVTRHAELSALAEAQRETAMRLQLLRDKCAIALASLKERAPQMTALIDHAQKLCRRKPDHAALTQLLQDISVEISEDQTTEPENLRGTDPKYEGHKDPEQTQSVKEKDLSKIEVTPDQMERAYPKLCAELRLLRNHRACDRHMDDLAKALHLGEVWPQVQALGPTMKFILLGYLLERAQDMRSPKGYLITLLRRLEAGQVVWQDLLRKPKKNI